MLHNHATTFCRNIFYSRIKHYFCKRREVKVGLYGGGRGRLTVDKSRIYEPTLKGVGGICELARYQYGY